MNMREKPAINRSACVIVFLRTSAAFLILKIGKRNPRNIGDECRYHRQKTRRQICQDPRRQRHYIRYVFVSHSYASALLSMKAKFLRVSLTLCNPYLDYLHVFFHRIYYGHHLSWPFDISFSFAMISLSLMIPVHVKAHK